MTAHSGKFMPRPRPETAAWWEGCRGHKLMIQRCSQCGVFQFYPRIVCSSCMSDQVEWVQSSGRGEVSTFTICRLPVAEAYAADVPYVVALIQLEEPSKRPEVEPLPCPGTRWRVHPGRARACRVEKS